MSRKHHSVATKLRAPTPYKCFDRRVYTDHTRFTKPFMRPQNSTNIYTPLVYPELPNQRCKIQLRTPSRKQGIRSRQIILTWKDM